MEKWLFKKRPPKFVKNATIFYQGKWEIAPHIVVTCGNRNNSFPFPNSYDWIYLIFKMAQTYLFDYQNQEARTSGKRLPVLY